MAHRVWRALTSTLTAIAFLLFALIMLRLYAFAPRLALAVLALAALFLIMMLAGALLRLARRILL